MVLETLTEHRALTLRALSPARDSTQGLDEEALAKQYSCAVLVEDSRRWGGADVAAGGRGRSWSGRSGADRDAPGPIAPFETTRQRARCHHAIFAPRGCW